jgi:hypothetical protein
MPTITRSDRLDGGDLPAKVADLQAAAILNTTNVATIANASGQTLTAAQVAGGIILRSGAAAVTDTTPTAAAIIAAFPGAVTGDVMTLVIRNNNTGTLTIGAGTGVTLEGTTTIPTVNTRMYAVRITSATTVTISGLFVAAV